jgi:hypothetical protein
MKKRKWQLFNAWLASHGFANLLAVFAMTNRAWVPDPMTKGQN